MDVSVEELPSLVTDGALFMDAIDPDWYWIVDPETLDMVCGGWCVLGQHHPLGGYRPEDYGLDLWDGDTRLLGFFFVEWREHRTEWTRLWRDEITDRRAAYLERVGSKTGS